MYIYICMYIYIYIYVYTHIHVYIYIYICIYIYIYRERGPPRGYLCSDHGRQLHHIPRGIDGSYKFTTNCTTIIIIIIITVSITTTIFVDRMVSPRRLRAEKEFGHGPLNADQSSKKRSVLLSQLVRRSAEHLGAMCCFAVGCATCNGTRKSSSESARA